MERLLHVSQRAIKAENVPNLNHQSPLHDRLEVALQLIALRFQRLQDVPWIRYSADFPENIRPEFATWLPPTEEYPNSAIFLHPEKHASLNEWLISKMEPSVEMMANAMGVTIDGIRRFPDILTVFAYFHELGHARAFFARYVKHATSTQEAEKRFMQNRQQEIASLPLPNLPPSYLMQLAQYNYRMLQRLFNENRERLTAMGIGTVDELLVAQQVTYRNLPTEAEADRFAGYAIQIFWDYLGFPDDIRVPH